MGVLFTEMSYRDEGEAFEDAIKSGRLSADETASNFAGNYMYMGTWSGADAFKHRDTRQYIA